MLSRERNPLVVGRVIGDVLDPFTNSIDLTITYNSLEVNNGFELKPSQVMNPPRVEVGGDDFRCFYTLIMVDPDAPSPSDPNLREYLHWLQEKVRWFRICVIITLVANIPATTGTSFGQEIVSYESPRPMAGIHRFIFVLFQQRSARETIYAPGWRQNFNTKDFAEFYELGSPVAAVYFNCQRETGRNRR